MEMKTSPTFEIPSELIEAIKSFPVSRTIDHCGTTFSVSPFDFYARCPKCGAQMKVRSCSGVTEIEEVFDAVFEWRATPEAREFAHHRQQVIQEDSNK
jgi:hypothetical protein